MVKEEQVDLKDKTYKTLTDLTPLETAELFVGKKLAARVAWAIANNADLNQPEIEAAQNFIDRMENPLTRLLPQGHMGEEGEFKITRISLYSKIY